MAAVRDHPRLQDVSPALIAREGLLEFYEDCGFAVMDEAIEHPDGDPERCRGWCTNGIDRQGLPLVVLVLPDLRGKLRERRNTAHAGTPQGVPLTRAGA